MVVPFHTFKLYPPILGLDNKLSVSAVICDMEPHFSKFWYDEDVRNPFLFEPKLDITKLSLIVGGSGPSVAVPK